MSVCTNRVCAYYSMVKSIECEDIKPTFLTPWDLHCPIHNKILRYNFVHTNNYHFGRNQSQHHPCSTFLDGKDTDATKYRYERDRWSKYRWDKRNRRGNEHWGRLNFCANKCNPVDKLLGPHDQTLEQKRKRENQCITQ